MMTGGITILGRKPPPSLLGKIVKSGFIGRLDNLFKWVNSLNLASCFSWTLESHFRCWKRQLARTNFTYLIRVNPMFFGPKPRCLRVKSRWSMVLLLKSALLRLESSLLLRKMPICVCETPISGWNPIFVGFSRLNVEISNISFVLQNPSTKPSKPTYLQVFGGKNASCFGFQIRQWLLRVCWWAPSSVFCWPDIWPGSTDAAWGASCSWSRWDLRGVWR